ncbi:ATP-binding protein [Vibrio splendidus]|uniref:ATP-binding protein n=1 Tax=Vibrio splendidus TaxID=29497 RepID=UPI000C82D27B|nr:ATP-binding protein [Vibrio splendidus]PMM16822.1 hypothetical protein BCT62_05235 [Vibrio splendidus]PMN26594.1 hypothetical protein BCT36_01285 [Vibrio splendidus]
MKEIYFVSGIHGAGKGTLCQEVNEKIGLPVYSCSDLIKQNSEYVECGKVVSTAERNQEALIHGLNKINEDKFILDGHFCLVGQNDAIIELGYEVFDAIGPVAVINVVCDPVIVHQRMLERDGSALEVSLLDKLQVNEVKRVNEFCEARSIGVYTYESGKSTESLLDILK